MDRNEWNIVTEKQSPLDSGNCQKDAKYHKETNSNKISVLLLKKYEHPIHKYTSRIFCSYKDKLSQESKLW